MTHALKVLGEIQEKRDEEMANMPKEATHKESDLENDSAAPLFD